SGSGGLAIPNGFPALPCNAPAMPNLKATFTNASYSPKGELLNLPAIVWSGSNSWSRAHQATYDALGRQQYAGVTSGESGSSILRYITYNYSQWSSGIITRSGSDGSITTVQFDTANRPLYVERKDTTTGVVLMSAAFAYDALGRLESVTYGNNASTYFVYNAAHRVTQIRHRDATTGATMLLLEYTYTADDLPLTITESGTTTTGATVTYTYDNRSRLTQEVRTGDSPYSLVYAYDAGGNRTKKIDALTYAPDVLQTEYTYDTSSPATYGSNNNRLVSYAVSRVSSGQVQTLLSTTWYYYTLAGNVERVVTKPEASATYTATRFGYAFNGRTVTFAMGETWDDATVCPPVNYHIEWAREFRYDGARARYLNRPLNPVALMSGNFVSLGDTWTDYDGDSAYGDFEVTPGYPPTVANRRSYEPGLAQVDPWMSSGGTATDYVMGDHLGTARGLIMPNGTGVEPVVYSAFGERISGTNLRFGYVGSFGYQSHGEFGFLHVGHRYLAARGESLLTAVV
ncbi:MAG: hypothetical protein Q7R41_05435, partial [Phycisphaerales bacterium]|nr:hypothetical protein [Phycisphaerales bacterium]